MSTIDPVAATRALQANPGLPADTHGPVFREPWEAQAFAMVLTLHEQGVFGWPEWAAMLGETIKAAQRDAASARSMTAQFAGANNLAYAKADVVIDAVPTAGEIGKALTRLAGIAKTNGTAVGVASALPVSIERIAQWIKTVKGGGYILVPISVAATRSKSS